MMNFMEVINVYFMWDFVSTRDVTKAVQVLSYAFSPTWAVKILRFAVAGGEVSQVLPYVLTD